MTSRARAFLVLALLFAAACRERGLSPREGFVSVPGGKVWYRIMGSGSRTPLLLLHGGPGGRSCGFSVLADLAKDRPVVLYDQLGSGRSERPADASLWRTDRFVDELAAVREGLGLTRVHILGHSWGGALAAEYLLTKKPAGVVSVVFSSPLLSTPQWVADARRLRSTLPHDLQDTLARCEAVNTADEPACKAAADAFDERFVRGAKSLPDLEACDGSTRNDEIYRRMWGAAEFTATGSLRDFDRTDRLGELKLPVLFLAGRDDEAVPETVEGFQQRVPGARMTVFEHSAHSSYRTETALYVQAVGDFLREAESGTFAGVDRGRYLANGITRCFWCHSPLDGRDPALPIPASFGSGDVLDDKAPINAPNLTPDRETGLGLWKDAEIVAAIREGRGRDGRRLAEHPANHYSVMTDEDAAAIASYLRTLRPIARRLAASAPQTRHHESTQPFVDPARPWALQSPIQRGAYLVQLGECMGCHTPADADGNPVRALTFGGGRRFLIEKGVGSEVSAYDPMFTSAPASDQASTGHVVASANISPGPSGISYFTEDIFIQTIRTGKVAGVRPLSAAMPWVFFRTMTDADLRDIFVYLKGVRGVQHRVNNSDPPTWCPRCGRRHGLGEFNVPLPGKG
jgi:proline iminopeptidase